MNSVDAFHSSDKANENEVAVPLRKHRIQCTLCSKSYGTTSHFNFHMKEYHSNERPYGCEFCAKMFATTFRRNTRQKSHVKQYPDLCDICDKSFYSKHSLKKHQLMHTTRSRL